MAPIIHCIRHAQGLHNVAGNYDLIDPRITSLGREQSDQLRQNSFSDQSTISLVVASPMCRALETAANVFRPALGAGGKCSPRILALPDLQETSDDICDIGTEKGMLQSIADEQQWPVDLSLIEEGWNDKSLGSRYGPQADAIRTRARAARHFLKYRIHGLVQAGDLDCEIAIVSHGSFLHFFTEDWENPALFPGTGWKNCEVRSYVFPEQSTVESVEEARLVETMESRRARGKSHPMFRGDSQTLLYQIAMKLWGEQGLQRPDTVGTADA